MCETVNCPHEKGTLCTCEPVKSGDIVAMIQHVAVNLCEPVWELDYTSLDKPEKRRLCIAGVCRLCGGRLCHGLTVRDELTGDELLATMYRHLFQAHSNGWQYIKTNDFRDRFLMMFHEEDRPFIHEWLSRPENQSVHTMYRRNPAHRETEPAEQDPVFVYSIVRTGIDTDRGSFPEPQCEGSYLSSTRARLEFERLVAAEREKLDDRYDGEECGENHWEAYQEGYAAALFSRLEILSTPLCSSSIEETTESFTTEKYLLKCSQCVEEYEVPGCKAGEECPMLEKAQENLRAVLEEERTARRKLLRNKMEEDM